MIDPRKIASSAVGTWNKLGPIRLSEIVSHSVEEMDYELQLGVKVDNHKTLIMGQLNPKT